MKCLFTAEHLACRLSRAKRCFIEKSINVGTPLKSEVSIKIRRNSIVAVGGTISKTRASVTTAFTNTRKMMKARNARLIAFTVFECLGTLMKHDAPVFEVAPQSRLRNKRTGNTHVLSASLLLRGIVLL